MTNDSFQPNESGSAQDPGTIESAWAEFKSLYPTEEDSLKELCRLIFEAGSECSNCLSSELEHTNGGRTANCLNCHQEISITAGTFFSHIKKARPWLAAIWLMDRKMQVNPSQFCKLAQIAYSTAWEIFRKLAMAMQNEQSDEHVEVPSALFITLFCRRSLETHKRKHPASEEVQEPKEEEEEEEEEPMQHPVPTPDSMIESSSSALLIRSVKAIYELLSDKPTSFEELCRRSEMPPPEISATLTLLELEGLVLVKPGDCYICSNATKSTRVRGRERTVKPDERMEEDAVIGKASEIMQFIVRIFHGISRKYLQGYLATYWFYHDHKRWRKGSLLRACLRFGVISRDGILAYVSPLLVRVAFPSIANGN